MHETAHVLALISEETVLDDLLRLAAAAGCEIERVADLAALRAGWQGAAVILLDPGSLETVARAGVPRRSRVLLACGSEPTATTLQAALSLGVERVVHLPNEEDWLVGALADVVDRPAGAIGQTVAVLGARGGAGASVFAAAAACTASKSGRPTLLVDCDPLGGGLDVLLGVEDESGLRWPDVRLTSGRLAASALRSALVEAGRHGPAVLSCSRDGGGPTAEAVAAVIEAGARSGSLVLCDLPRTLSATAEATLQRADLAVVVVPAEVRACGAARGLLASLAERGVRTGIVVRGPAPGGLRAPDVAEALQVPLLAEMRAEPGLDRLLERGRFVPKARGPLATATGAVLRALRDHSRTEPAERAA
jgi:secretion/DNA translocation related CpaE-like protein